MTQKTKRWSLAVAPLVSLSPILVVACATQPSNGEKKPDPEKPADPVVNNSQLLNKPNQTFALTNIKDTFSSMLEIFEENVATMSLVKEKIPTDKQNAFEAYQAAVKKIADEILINDLKAKINALNFEATTYQTSLNEIIVLLKKASNEILEAYKAYQVVAKASTITDAEALRIVNDISTFRVNFGSDQVIFTNVETPMDLIKTLESFYKVGKSLFETQDLTKIKEQLREAQLKNFTSHNVDFIDQTTAQFFTLIVKRILQTVVIAKTIEQNPSEAQLKTTLDLWKTKFSERILKGKLPGAFIIAAKQINEDLLINQIKIALNNVKTTWNAQGLQWTAEEQKKLTEIEPFLKELENTYNGSTTIEASSWNKKSFQTNLDELQANLAPLITQKITTLAEFSQFLQKIANTRDQIDSLNIKVGKMAKFGQASLLMLQLQTEIGTKKATASEEQKTLYETLEQAIINFLLKSSEALQLIIKLNLNVELGSGYNLSEITKNIRDLSSIAELFLLQIGVNLFEDISDQNVALSLT